LAAGFFFTVLFFLIFWVSPNIFKVPILVMMLGVLLILALARFITAFNWAGDKGLHRFSFVSGALGWFVLLAPLQEMDPTRTDNPARMTLVGLLFLVGSSLLWWRIRQLKRVESQDVS